LKSAGIELSEADSWLLRQFRACRAVVEPCYCGISFWEDFSVNLVNTRRGSEVYVKETGKSPELHPTEKWRSENGNLETHSGQRFIFIDPVLIENRAELAVQSALQHQIFRALHPYCSRKELEQIEESVASVAVLDVSVGRSDGEDKVALINARVKKKM